MKRVFASIRAIVNIAITEHGYDCSTAFSKTFFPEEENVSKRKPIPIENIRTIQSKCMEQADQLESDAKQGVEYLNTVRYMLQEYNETDRHTIPLTGDLVE